MGRLPAIPENMNCINSSWEGRYPFVTAQAFPNASHEAGEDGSNVVMSKESNPFCEVAVSVCLLGGDCEAGPLCTGERLSDPE